MRFLCFWTLCNRVRSSEIQRDPEIGPLPLWIKMSQLRWFWHLTRMPAGRDPVKLYLALTGQRLQGRPRTHWGGDYASPSWFENIQGSPRTSWTL